MAFFDKVAEPFKEWSGYVGKNHIGYYLGLLKILIVAAVAGFIIFTVFAVISGILASTEPGAGILVGIVLMAVGLLAGEWIQRALKLTAIIYTDAEFSKKRFAMLDAFSKIKWPVLRYLLLEIIILLILSIPAIILFGMATMNFIEAMGSTLVTDGQIPLEDLTSTLASVMPLYFAGLAYEIAIIIGFAFLAQFWAYGFLIQGKGVVDSLKDGIGIVKNNAALVVVFDMVWIIGILVFAIPLIAYNIFFNQIAYGILLLAGLGGGGIVAIGVLVFNFLITVALSTLVTWFALPTQYLFWKKRTAMEMPAEPKPAAKAAPAPNAEAVKPPAKTTAAKTKKTKKRTRKAKK